MARLLILVEGQTEERFVKDLLGPHLVALNPVASVQVTVIPTKRVLSGGNYRGGLVSPWQMKDALQRLLKDRGALVTTLFDLYGLPAGMPGLERLRPGMEPKHKAIAIEEAIRNDLGNPQNLHVHLSLHEFEAFLFAAPHALEEVSEVTGLSRKLATIRSQFQTPEHINDGKDTAPSKRILALHPGYGKTTQGVNAVRRIGLERLREECPHFGAWLGRLESHVQERA